MNTRLAAAAAMAGVLAGCASSPPPPAAEPPPAARAPSEPADPERRARVRLDLAAAYFGNGQTQTAAAELRQVLALKPDMPEAHSLLALVQAADGDLRAAESSFQRALQLAPRDGDTMHNYGWFLCQQRRWEAADQQFQAALAQPAYREGARTLFAAGLCQARAGRWTDAERSFMRSYELDASNPSTAYNLSEVLYRRGDYERARFYLRRVNAAAETSNALSLWLAARVERKLGNAAGVQDFGRQLRERFPQAEETQAFERGRFDD